MKYALALILGLTLSIQAATIQVDLNGQSGPNETGYSGWNFANGFAGALNESNSFAYAEATDGTLDSTWPRPRLLAVATTALATWTNPAAA
jgi:hypothetical protein